jgi:probable rRNA maturation factor
MDLKIAYEDRMEPSDGLTSLLEGILRAVVETEELPHACEVSLLLCGNARIKELNHQYRHINSSTDVLSFPLFADRGEMLAETGEVLPLGDIVISLDKAREQADSYGHSLEREAGFLFVHGLLHLVGYDHELPEETLTMRRKEEAILELRGLGRNTDAGPQV